MTLPVNPPPQPTNDSQTTCLQDITRLVDQAGGMTKQALLNIYGADHPKLHAYATLFCEIRKGAHQHWRDISNTRLPESDRVVLLRAVSASKEQEERCPAVERLQDFGHLGAVGDPRVVQHVIRTGGQRWWVTLAQYDGYEVSCLNDRGHLVYNSDASRPSMQMWRIRSTTGELLSGAAFEVRAGSKMKNPRKSITLVALGLDLLTAATQPAHLRAAPRAVNIGTRHNIPSNYLSPAHTAAAAPHSVSNTIELRAFVQQYMKQNGVYQKDVAALCDVPGASFSKWMTNSNWDSTSKEAIAGKVRRISNLVSAWKDRLGCVELAEGNTGAACEDCGVRGRHTCLALPSLAEDPGPDTLDTGTVKRQKTINHMSMMI